MKYDVKLLPQVDRSVGILSPVVAWAFLSVFACVAFSVLGGFLEAAGVVPKGADALFLVAGTVAAAVFVVARLPGARKAVRAMKLREATNFDWYRETFPSAVGNGNVSCVHCGGRRIGTRRRMNKEFMVEHHCHTCGEVLYHSKEQR